MIVRLRGIVLETGQGSAVLECGGVGYEVHMAASDLRRLPAEGQEASLHIIESTALYGGSTSLYGFLDAEGRVLFEAVKEHVPNTGAKKALEILDKASRSLPDFRRAVLDRDAKTLSELFGFTKKTAERIVEALKDKLPAAGASGVSPAAAPAPSGPVGQALQALASLGYRAGEAREAIESVRGELAGREASVEDLIKLALKKL